MPARQKTTTARSIMADLLSPGEERDLFVALRGARTITFYMNPGFGNGKDQAGNDIGPTAERDAAIRCFESLLDEMAAGMQLPVERIVTFRAVETKAPTL